MVYFTLEKYINTIYFDNFNNFNLLESILIYFIDIVKGNHIMHSTK